MTSNVAIFFIVTAAARVGFADICIEHNVFHTASEAKREARSRLDSPTTLRAVQFVHKIAVSDDGCNVRVDTVATERVASASAVCATGVFSYCGSKSP